MFSPFFNGYKYGNFDFQCFRIENSPLSLNLMATNETKQTILNLSQALIAELTDGIKNDINTLQINSSEEVSSTVFNQCEQRLTALKDRIEQLKKLYLG